MSQQAIADKIGITRSMVCKIEKGRASPSWEIANKIEDLLGVPARILLKKDDE